jgi:hypothetical protein
MMKFRNFPIIGIALISINGVAETPQSIPSDANAHLLKRLGLKEDFEGPRYFFGEKSGSYCFVEAEVNWEGGDALRFVITVSNPTKFNISRYQGRFGKDYTDAVEFSESDRKLNIVNQSEDADAQLSHLEIISDSAGNIQNIQVSYRKKSLFGQLTKASAECSNLRPIARENLNDQSRENESSASSDWSLSGIRIFFRQMRERMEPKYLPEN